MTPSESFHVLFESSDDPRAVCALFILSWIATCDGTVSENELAVLRQVAEAAGIPEELEAALRCSQSPTIRELQHACVILRGSVPRAQEQFLRTAIMLAAADRRLTASENHVLRFLADLLGYPSAVFASLFCEVTGVPLPLPSDPSNLEWWQRTEDAYGAQDKPDATDCDAEDCCGQHRDSRPMDRIRALAILGLEEGASQAELQESYRRLAKLHHPDRYQTFGQKSVDAATQTFKRIQAAYETLRYQ